MTVTDCDPPHTDSGQYKLNDAAHEGSTRTTAAATLALPPELEQLYGWSEANGNAQTFLLLVDVLLLLERPRAVGSLLAVLSSEDAYETLQDWAKDNDAAAKLFRLSGAVCTDPAILDRHPPITHAIASINMVRGKSAQLYLMALLVARLPVISKESQQWFEILRLWLLVHALGRATKGDILDENLQLVCTKLRLAQDTTSEWLGFFGQLYSGQYGFSGLNLHLSYLAEGLMKQSSTEGPALGSGQRQVLRALISIARHKTKPFEAPHALPRKLAQLVQDAAIEPQDDTPPVGQEPFEEGQGGIWELPGTDTSDPVRLVEIDPTESPQRQRLSAKSVLLVSAEENQYLSWYWHQPTALEQKHLDAWLEQSLQAQSPLEEQLRAATVWIAAATGRSLRRCLEISLADRVGSEWSLSTDASHLQMAPLHPRSSWTPDSKALGWIQSQATHLEIVVPEAIRNALATGRILAPGATTLGDLCRDAWQPESATVFRSLMSSIAPRLTPRMLSRVLPTRAFGVTGDALLARLVSSHKQSGLPGAASYPAWPMPLVSGLLNPLAHIGPESALQQYTVGSFLQVRDHRLSETVRLAAKEIAEERESDQFFEFHNKFVAYHVVGLLAATGARPIQDPFERFRHFDLDRHFVYISDKVSAPVRDGRLVPIPDVLSAWVKHEYPRHLMMLADQLEPVAPKLASNIRSLTRVDVVARMPLFFFLEVSDRGNVEWRSVSETTINRLGLFGWPLPLNLFRHRLASRLREYRLDPEIIDALLGHSEAWSATHGDYSWRVWERDMAEARQPLNSLFEAAGFAVLSSWGEAPALPAGIKCEANYEPRLFGQDARAAERRRRHRVARREAALLIREAVGTRSLADLNEGELTELSRRLLTTGKGMPHPQAGLRYECLVRRTQRIWKTTGKHVRLKRSIGVPSQEATLFTDTAPGAKRSYELVLEVLEGWRTEIKTARPGRSDSAYLATMLLVMENRITDRRLLQCVMQGKAIRLVAKGESVFLEFSPAHAEESSQSNFSVDADPEVPVRRFHISSGTAWLLDRVLGTHRKQITPPHDIPGELDGVSKHLCQVGRLRETPAAGHLIESLAELVEQVNGMELPGVLAAYLAGRVESYGLEWREWLRLRWGEHRYFSCNNPPENRYKDEPALNHTTPISLGGDKVSLQLSARTLFKSVRAILRDQAADASGEGGARALSRRGRVVAIKDLLDEQGAGVSTAIQALATWTLHLLGRGDGRQLATSSVMRYLSSLSGAFESVAYDVDLLSLDDEGLMALYADVLEVQEIKHLRYSGRRLAMFHRWAREHYGLEDPDWSELPLGDVSVDVDAGLLLEEEYLSALHSLLTADQAYSCVGRHAAFLLLCVYRFGLRGGEARGLTRADWNVQDHLQVVLVRPNPLRKLKTAGSKRMVPLVFRLTEEEASLVRERLLRAESIHGDREQGLLFCMDDGQAVDWVSVKAMAIRMLKQVTGNPGANLHRARHAAANRVMLGLLGNPISGWDRVISQNQGMDLAGMLLGRSANTRSAAWALARYMGHTNPKTALRSYLHFLGDMADGASRMLRANEAGYKSTTVNAIQLETFPQFCPVNMGVLSGGPTPTFAPSPADVIKLLRLMARGRPIEQIVDVLRLDLQWARRVEEIVNSVGENISLGPVKSGEPHAPNRSLAFLRRIKESAWKRLLSAATENSRDADKPTGMEGLEWNAVPWMIGRTGQIVLVREAHFRLLAQVFDFWRIDSTRYDMVITTTRGKIMARAQGYGFAPREKVDRDGNYVRIDTATTDEDGSKATERCACLFRENNDYFMRNRLEFVVACVSVVTSIKN